jgi:phospholipid N-methyltransferase
MQDLRIGHEKSTRKLLTKLHQEHQLEKQEIAREFEEKLNELYKVIEEKEKIIRDNQRAYTYISEMIPEMQMLSEHNAMLIEMEQMRITKKKQKYDYIADGWFMKNEYLKKKAAEFKKLMRLK